MYPVYEILTGTKFLGNYWDGDSVLSGLRDALFPAGTAGVGSSADPARAAFGSAAQFDRVWTLVSAGAMATRQTVRPSGLMNWPVIRYAAWGRGHRRGRQAVRQQAGRGAEPGNYLVRDKDTDVAYSFDYTDIVTEGFSAIRVGERVRFLIGQAHPGRANYVIRLDLPEVEAYYQ